MSRISNRRMRRQLEAEGLLLEGNMYRLGANAEWRRVDCASLPGFVGRYPAQLFYVSPSEFDVPVRVVISHPDTPNPVVLSMCMTVYVFLSSGGAGLWSMMQNRRLQDCVMSEHVSDFLAKDYSPKLRNALESMADRMPAGRWEMKDFLENLGVEDKRRLVPPWLTLKSISVSVEYEKTADQKRREALVAERQLLQARQAEIKVSAMALSLGQAGAASAQKQQECEERIKQSVLREMDSRQAAMKNSGSARAGAAVQAEIPPCALVQALRRHCDGEEDRDVALALADGGDAVDARLAVKLQRGGYVTVLCIGDDGQLRLLVPNAADRVSSWEKGEYEFPVVSGGGAPQCPAAGFRDAYVVLSGAPLVTPDGLSMVEEHGGHVVTAEEKSCWDARLRRWEPSDWSAACLSISVALGEPSAAR